MVSQNGSKMPKTDVKDINSRPLESSGSSAQSTSGWSSLFALPGPVKRLFDAFPLRTYPANPLPCNLQIKHTRDCHAFFIWATKQDALNGTASFNPSCFRWQLYLRSRNIHFHTVASNNHASTLDRLPFLVVNDPKTSPFGQNELVAARDLTKWAADQIETWPKELDVHYDAYMSLLNNEIRLAWQHHMYLTDNFDAFVVPSYIGSQTQSRLVQLASAHELRKAARKDFLQVFPVVDERDIHSRAESAFEALDNILARKMRIQGGGFADREPSLLEATLYAYLYLLLELPMSQWKDARLPGIVRKYPELLRMHRDYSSAYPFRPPSTYRS